MYVLYIQYKIDTETEVSKAVRVLKTPCYITLSICILGSLKPIDPEVEESPPDLVECSDHQLLELNSTEWCTPQ